MFPYRPYYILYAFVFIVFFYAFVVDLIPISICLPHFFILFYSYYVYLFIIDRAACYWYCGAAFTALWRLSWWVRLAYSLIYSYLLLYYYYYCCYLPKYLLLSHLSLSCYNCITIQLPPAAIAAAARPGPSMN